MENDSAALLIAWLSLGVSSTSILLTWIMYRLAGARLHVRLSPAILTPIGHVIRGPESGWPKKGPGDRFDTKVWLDLVRIRVVNIGRTAVSVEDIQLDLGALHWWRPWSRHTVAGRPIRVHEGTGAVQDTPAVRLEPGEPYYVFMPPLDVVRTATKDKVAIRATARPSGRHVVRSPWRHRLRLRRDQEAIWPWDELTAESKVFQHVATAMGGDASTRIYEAWLDLLNYHNGHAVGARLMDVLSEYMPPMTAAMASIRIERLLTDVPTLEQRLEAQDAPTQS